jgi:hypothetical protein
VAHLLKTRSVQLEKQPLLASGFQIFVLRNGRETNENNIRFYAATSALMDWLSSYHVGTTTDTKATIVQQQGDVVFHLVRAEML